METSTNTVIWIFPPVKGKLRCHEFQWTGKVRELFCLFVLFMCFVFSLFRLDCGNALLFDVDLEYGEDQT